MSERRLSSDTVDRILSLCAGIAAITAVAVSLYQSALARQQLRASAWPYLMQYNSFAGGQFTRVVENDGVGPVRVRTFEVLVDKRPVATWNDAVRTLAGSGEPKLVYSSIGRGIVIPAGVSRLLLTMPKGERGTKFYLEAQTRLETVICYCSVYDECWRSSSEEREPQPIRVCTDDPVRRFRQ